MYSNIYWVDIPLPGQLGITARPRGDDWLDDEIQAWCNSGVEVVVSALTLAEETELGLGDERQICQNKGIEYISLPIPDRQTPSTSPIFLSTLE